MAEYDDDERRYDEPADDDRADRRRRTIQQAKERVSTPATLMIVTGILLYLFFAVSVVILASGVDIQVAMMEWTRDNVQMQGPDKAQFEKQLEDARNRNKTPEMIQQVLIHVVGLILNTLVLIGGFRMKALKGYSLALTGSICALVPLTSCCCIAMPVGLWAVIVLSNEQVKAGFKANSAPVQRGDDRDY